MIPARSAGHSAGPAELIRSAAIARRYYLDGRSKLEIAEEFGLSRFKVARLLDEARASGLVRIEIGFPGDIDLDLSAALTDRYDLHHAVVVDVPGEEDLVSLRGHVGRAAAQLVSEVVVAGDVLGLAWGRALAVMSRAIEVLPPCTIVQLNGAMSRADTDDTSVDLVRAVAKVSGGQSYPFYAPFIAATAADADVMRRQPDVARAIQHFDTLTKAVISIGCWDPPQSTLYDATTHSERIELTELGVRADASGVFIGDDGQVVDTPLTQRVIAMSGAQLVAVPEVIALAYGGTDLAVQAVLRGGIVTGLVTHTALAKQLLDGST